MFERGKMYVFKRLLFMDDMNKVFEAKDIVNVKWACEIDDKVVIPLSDDEGYCGDYYVCREWCEELEMEDC